MKWRRISAVPASRIAVTGVMLGCAAALGTLMRALQEPDPTPAIAETIILPSLVHPRDRDRLMRTYDGIDDDPFFPDRTQPASRYQLIRAAALESLSVSTNVAQVPTVLGTVLGADGLSFAICAVDSTQLKTVRLGETIGTYRVTAIERGRVVFTTATGQRIGVPNNQAAVDTQRRPFPRRARRNNPDQGQE